MNQPLPLPEPTPEPAPADAGLPPICRSEELLKGGRLLILHRGETYHLRLTQSGKLLLTK